MFKITNYSGGHHHDAISTMIQLCPLLSSKSSEKDTDRPAGEGDLPAPQGQCRARNLSGLRTDRMTSVAPKLFLRLFPADNTPPSLLFSE